MLTQQSRTTEKKGGLAVAVVCTASAAFLAWSMLNRRKKKKEQQNHQQLAAAKIHIETIELVRPTGTVKTQREILSEVDEWLCSSSHWLSFTIKFDYGVNYGTLKLGLQRTIQHVPCLASRVNTTKQLYELVFDPNNCGVLLEYATATTLNSDSSTSSVQQILPDDKMSRNDWKQFGLDGLESGYSGLPKLTDPLFRARLINFDNASYLTIGLSHCLCDGHGIRDVLQIWSYFCCHDNPNNLPEPLRQPRLMIGKRQYQPARPAKNQKELMKRCYDETGCIRNPFTLHYFVRDVLFYALWCMNRQINVELRVNATKMKQLKASVTEQLQNANANKEEDEQDEWVSTFEVLVAAFLLATNIENLAANRHKLHVSCDLRGRSRRFPIDYFGNAAFDFCRLLKLPDSNKLTWNVETLTIVAKAVHVAIRSGITDPEFVCKTKDWFEAARHLGLKNTYDVWPAAIDALQGIGTFVNSWGNGWLDITMGSARKASCMTTYFGMVQNFMLEVPRHRETNDTTIYMALPPDRFQRFITLCEMEQNQSDSLFPFTVVQRDR